MKKTLLPIVGIALSLYSFHGLAQSNQPSVIPTGPKASPLKSARTMDQVIPDDLIIQGSGCVGFGCVMNESFGFHTLRLKEDNTRIGFEDASTSAGYPSNDWELEANGDGLGATNHFAIRDVTGSRTPFKIMAGAPENSLLIYSLGIGINGKIGIRTDSPGLDFHVTSSNTPALRLEQTNISYSAQTWDIGGNEANFFIRDLTGGSRLSFRIRPGAPTSSIDINGNGFVGIGIAAPKSKLHVEGGAYVMDTLYIGRSAYIKDSLRIAGNVYIKDTLFAPGFVGIGTTLPSSKLHVEGGAFIKDSLHIGGRAYIKDSLQVDGNVYVRDTLFAAGFVGIDSGLLTSSLRVEGGAYIRDTLHVGSSAYIKDSLRVDGNVYVQDTLFAAGFVGTELRTSKLHVDGSTHIKDTLHVSGSTYIQDSLRVDGNVYVKDTLFAAGFVGIGSHLLTSKLHVEGGAYIKDTLHVGSSAYIKDSLRVDGNVYVNGNVYTKDTLFATQEILDIDTLFVNSFIGLGTKNPKSKLHVEGSIYIRDTLYVKNHISMGVTLPSDRKLKTDISSLQKATTLLMGLHPKTYTYNAARYPLLGLSSGIQYGLIAQEVEQVLPALVSQVNHPGGTTFKSVNYVSLIPILIQGIKEQQAEIAELKKELAEVIDLKKRLDALEASLHSAKSATSLQSGK